MVEHKILFDDDADALVESNLHVSPAEILEKEFAQRFRGYDVHQVDAFLEEVAKEVDRVLKENTRLKEEVENLKEQLAASREKERSLNEELLVAQTMGDDIRARAEQEASHIVSGAQLDAQKVMAEVRQQCASLQQEIAVMNQKREQFETSLRSLLEGYLNTLGK
jgi:cell division initiation protein